MTDRRLLAFNGRVADIALKGQVEAERFVQPRRMMLAKDAWLRRAPEGPIDRECLTGDPFDVIEDRGGHVFGRGAKDGYVGWLPSDALTDPVVPTHRIAVRTTWAYRAPDFKTEPVRAFHMTSRVTVSDETRGWAAISDGALFLPLRHLAPLEGTADPVAAARAFLGTPYVWAGNSGFGIDCSGLVQIACQMAGIDAPRDTDMQERALGTRVAGVEALQRGDLVFWKGHVGIMLDGARLLHANAHHMLTAIEPLMETMARFEERGVAVTSVRRLRAAAAVHG